MKLNAYDKIAPVYDTLVRIVFGKTIADSQKALLPTSHNSVRVLIIGGGSGYILEEVLTRNPQAEIWYVEASAKMISLSKKRNVKGKVHFIHGAFESIFEKSFFDLVVTNYFLDQFATHEVGAIATKIREILRGDGLWLVTDFTNSQALPHRVLLRLMYHFFRLFVGLQASALPEWNAVVLNLGYTITRKQTFYQGFIESVLYAKNS